MVTVRDAVELLQAATTIDVEIGNHQYELKKQFCDTPNPYLLEAIGDCVVESITNTENLFGYYIRVRSVPVRREAEK